MRQVKSFLKYQEALGKCNKKGFYKYFSDKRKSRGDVVWENVVSLLHETEDLVTWNSEKVKVLNDFFATFFTSKTGFQETQVPEASLNICSKENVPLVEEDQMREHLSKLDIHKSIGPDGINL